MQADGSRCILRHASHRHFFCELQLKNAAALKACDGKSSCKRGEQNCEFFSFYFKNVLTFASLSHVFCLKNSAEGLRAGRQCLWRQLIKSTLTGLIDRAIDVISDTAWKAF
jgi:hypothetical protein